MISFSAFEMDSLDIVLFALRFFIGSSILLGFVWLMERYNVLKNRDMTDTAWKAAIAGSILLLIPATANFAPNINISTAPNSVLSDIIPQERLSDATKVRPRPASTIAIPRSNANTQNQNLSLNSEAPIYLSAPSEEAFIDAQKWHMPAFLIIPFIIALLALLSLVFTYIAAMKSLGKRERISPDHQAFRLLFDICHKADIKATPYLTYSETVDSPLCLPTSEIVLPKWALTGLPDHELRGLIAHEVAHLRRFDPIILLILHAFARLFFLQPLLSLAQKRLADLAELAADEWAAGHSDNPKSVAEALFTCAKKITINQHQQQHWGLAMARDKSKLKARVERLLNATDTNFETTATWAKAAIAAALITTTFALPSFELTSVSADNDRGRNVNINSSEGENNGRKNGNMMYQDDDHLIRAKWDGAFFQSDDESTITKIDKDGYFKITEEIDDKDRSIAFKMVKGKIKATYKFDGSEKQMTAADKKWLKDTLLTFNRTGIYADERVKRLLKNGGVKTVLNEMDHIDGHALHTYTKALVDSRKLKENEVLRLIKILAKLDSDYEMRMAYTALLNSHDLPKGAMKDILAAAKSIESDYEMRQVITPLLDKHPLDDKLFSTLLDLSSTMDSDYEMRELLTVAISRRDMSPEHLVKVMKIARDRIDSDYELRTLISVVADQLGKSKEASTIAIESIEDIGSDYEQRMAAMMIIEFADLDTKGWKALIKSIDNISSDYETALALIGILEKMPKDNNLLRAVERSAEANISSDHEGHKIEKALDEYKDY